MKYIKLHAYYALNLGDDLMVDILIKKFPQYHFYIEGDIKKTAPFLKNRNFSDKEYYYRKYGRLNHILDILTFNISKGWFFKKLFNSLERKCSCSVLIGGSLYMQRDQIETEQIQKRIKWEERYFKNGPLFVIGANFGSYSTEYYRQAYKEYFRKCKGVSFRDMKSKRLFADLPNVQYAPDVVLSIDNIPQSRNNTNRVLISVIDVSKKYGIEEYANAYELFISDFCRYVINIGKIPILMSFCEAEGDEEAIKRIENQLGQENSCVEKYYYRGDLEEALHVIADAEFILASRYHAMILALRFNKKFFALSYDGKITNVLGDIGCDLLCDIKNINNITPTQILECDDNLPSVDEYVDSSNNQFAQLKEYLENRK